MEKATMNINIEHIARPRKEKRKNRDRLVSHPPPQTPWPHELKEHTRLTNLKKTLPPPTLPTIPPTSVTSVTSVTSGKVTNFVEKKANENVYFFFTYERCRRRLPLIKMINEVEEVFVLLSPRRITNTCFGSTVLRVSKVRLFKDSIGLLAHDKKKKDGKPKKLARKMFQQIHLGFYTH